MMASAMIQRRDDDAQLGAETAPDPALFHPWLDLVCGRRPVHCGVDLRGPSNGRLIRYGGFPGRQRLLATKGVFAF